LAAVTVTPLPEVGKQSDGGIIEILMAEGAD